MKPIRSEKLRKSARGQNCMLNFPECRNQTETVVLCHSEEKGDKAMGQKADDFKACFGCERCHDIYDGRTRSDHSKGDKTFYFHRAMKRTWEHWIRTGIIKT